MRILHLLNHCRHSNGNVNVAVDLACAQAAHGHHVAYASEGGDYVDLLEGNGVPHHYLKQRVKDPIALASSLHQLVKLTSALKPDIIHVHMMSGALLGYAASRLCGVRLVTTVHNSFDTHSMLMRLGDRVVAVSESERRKLMARGFPAKKLEVVLNCPLDAARLRQFGRPESIGLKRPNIATICGLHKRKGVGDLIEAFRSVAEAFPDTNLYIVGGGPDRNALEEQATATGFGERIHFLGSLMDPLSALSEIDVFVLASYADPFPLVIMEARSAGCAVVASEVDGIPEALELGQSGILVPPKSPAVLADVLRGLLADPAKLAEARASALRNVERFNVNRMYADYLGVYQSLLKPRLATEQIASVE